MPPIPSLKERLRMALFEAGYPDVPLYGPGENPDWNPNWCGVPDSVMWKACLIAKAGAPHPCLPCWTKNRGPACIAGDCTANMGRVG